MGGCPLSKLVIAIDGPAGSGKSTVAKRLAQEFGLQYLDTGAMYRALALAASRAGIGPADGLEAAKLCKELEIRFHPGDPQRVVLNGEDVTSAIREPSIGDLASALSVHSPVRRELVARQQAMLTSGGFTLEGRDVTTVVAPNADVKVFMTASIEERAKRRFLELQAKGMDADISQIQQQIAERDHRDSTRQDSPLRVAAGVEVVDTDGLEIAEVVARIRALVPTVHR